MAKLTISGHVTRGGEVIEILEMLGGINRISPDGLKMFNGTNFDSYYTIEEDNYIHMRLGSRKGDYIKYTLEEFLSKFPYKVRDRVIIEKYKQIFEILSVEWCTERNVIMYQASNGWYYAENLKPYKEETMEDKLDLLQQLKDYFDNTPREVIEKEWHEYDKYNEIGPTVNEYLEYVNKIRHPQYPKTYEECCDVLKITNDERYIYIDVPLSYNKTLKVFTQLLICRDAYWEIAGWRPTKDDDGETFSLFYNRNSDKIDKCDGLYESNAILDFPTKEMREAFYENFKELINQCKELL